MLPFSILLFLMVVFFIWKTATMRLVLIKHIERLERKAQAIAVSATSKYDTCRNILSQMDDYRKDISKEKEFYELADEHDRLVKEISRLVYRGNAINKYNHLLLDLINTWCLLGAHFRIKRLVEKHCFESDFEEVLEED